MSTGILGMFPTTMSAGRLMLLQGDHGGVLDRVDQVHGLHHVGDEVRGAWQ